MLSILLLLALIRTLRGNTLSSPLEGGRTFLELTRGDSESHLGERVVSDIILSCFATIFACTWSAVQPNIPSPTDSPWTIFKRQFVTMVYALLAPEAITAWALRQRLAAAMIAKNYNQMANPAERQTYYQEDSILNTIRAMFHDRPVSSFPANGEVQQWTLAHGFFAQMGGFMLCKNGRPIQTLAIDATKDTRDNVILLWDKGAFISPTITEEEIKDRSKGDAISKTLILLQTTWFVVQCITRWSNRLPVTELEVITLGFAMLNGVTYGLWWHKPQNVGRPVFLEITLEPYRYEEVIPITSKTSYARRRMHEDVIQPPWKLVYLVPLHIIKALIRPLGKLADFNGLWRTVVLGDLRVAMFYSTTISSFKVYMTTTIIGVMFGLVHLIPSWFLPFASGQEKWLWRSSAIVITGGPVFLGFWLFSRRTRYEGIFTFCMMTTLPLYIISRIILLTVSLTSLRTLPTAALQTIDWTTFIPHI